MARHGRRAGRRLLVVDVERRQVLDDLGNDLLCLTWKSIVSRRDTGQPEAGYPADHDTGDDLAAPCPPRGGDPWQALAQQRGEFIGRLRNWTIRQLPKATEQCREIATRAPGGVPTQHRFHDEVVLIPVVRWR
jgi:hypothetical protein